jgi:GNAT superfamily N-acetyltransferase
LDFRPAEPEDAACIRELSRDIWGGRDYLARTIDRWIASGGVYVGVVDGEIIGLSRIKRLADDEWWLEGLRVAGRHQGKGYGRRLHEETMAELGRIARGVVRFCTGDDNRSVPLARRDGFRQILGLPFLFREYSGEGRPPLAEALARHGARVCPPGETGLVDFLLAGCRVDYAGLLPQGWHHLTATARTLTERLADAHVLACGSPGKFGAALVLQPSDQYPDELDLNLVSGPAETVLSRLVPCLGPLAVGTGRPGVGGAVPERYVDGLLAAGFRRHAGLTRQLVFELRLP